MAHADHLGDNEGDIDDKVLRCACLHNMRHLGLQGRAGFAVMRISTARGLRPVWRTASALACSKCTEAVEDIQIRRRALSDAYCWTGSSACHACVQGIDEGVKDYEIRRHALFYTDAGVRALYRQNVRQALLRRNSVNGRVYRDDPTIMAWGLLNEPRCEAWKVRGF